MADDRFRRVLPAGTMQGVPIEEYLAAAVTHGFDAISLRPADVERWLGESSRRAIADLGALVADAGVGIAELDPVAGWHDAPVSMGAVEMPAGAHRTMAWAAALGAANVTALVLPGEVHRFDEAVSGLDALGAIAADLGVGVQVEPFAWSSLHRFDEAAALVDAVGRPDSVGLMVDTWHLAQAGGGRDALADIDVRIVRGVQIADGHLVAAAADLAAENASGRLWPGEGSLEPGLVVADLVERGWTGPVSIEVFGPVADAMARADAARRGLDVVLDALSTGR